MDANRYREATERLVRAIQELARAQSLDDVQRVVRVAARELTACDGASVVLREGTNCYYADEDAVAPLWKGRRFPLTTCVSGWTMTHKTPAIIPDIYLDDRVPHDAYRPTFVKSLVMVPIRTIDPVGAIGNYWATERTPTSDEVSLLSTLADATSVAIENVQVRGRLDDDARARSELQQALEDETRDLERLAHRVSQNLRGSNEP